MSVDGQEITLPEHELHVTQSPEFEIVNRDLVIEVSSDGLKLGQLQISKGGIDWRPRKTHVPYVLSWEQFDRHMQQWEG